MDISPVAVLSIFGAGLLTGLSIWLAFNLYAYCARVGEQMRHDRAMNLALEDLEHARAEEVWAAIHAKEPKVADDAEINVKLWDTRLRLFLAAGDRLGFSSRCMCPAVLSLRNWMRLTDYLIGAEVLETHPTAGTRWADGATLEWALRELDAKNIPLPDWAPFDVRWAGNAKRAKQAETA